MIATLALLALLTIVLVAFVTMVSRDRSATQNYSQGIRAEQIALGGMDQVVSQLQEEIADPAVSSVNSNGGAAMYVPLYDASTNAVPQRMVAAGLTPIVTMSGTNVYAGAVNLAAVGNLTTNPSLNSRKITIARWTEPNLLLPTASNNFAASTPPSWIIVTRNGPEGFPAGTTPQSAGLITSSLNNATGAIGRYAYVVYDTSGLIDANVAGYPTAYASNAAGKGVLAWADLTQLPGITAADVQNLVNWRNPATFANYGTNVLNAATTNGFTQVANGDTTFLSRQELIKWTQQPGNTDWQQALPYLTTFSRELNGPTWGPTTNMIGATNAMFNYQANATNSEVQNPLIFNPRVQSPFPRNNGIEAVKGEPLVKYRFPLDKLSLFDKMGTQTLSAQDITDLQRYFGVDVAADSSGYYRHLNYPTKSATYVHGVYSGTSGIMTLDDVAKQNREPDFFELLQAGILQGSLGTSGYFGQSARWDMLVVLGRKIYGSNSSSYAHDYDPQETYQILRIGANIIDQWHADNYPTTITFTPAGSPTSENVYGICDLPYINQVWLKVYGPAENTAVAPSLYFYFQLWNPHQPSTYTTGPTGFRISPEQPTSGIGYPDGYYVMYTSPGIYSSSGPFAEGAVFPFSQPLVGTPGEWTTTPPVPSPFYQYAPNNGNINFTNATVAGYREPSLMTNNAWPMVAPNCSWTPPTNIAAICITNLALPSSATVGVSPVRPSSTNSFYTNWGYLQSTNNWSAINFPTRGGATGTGNPIPLYYVEVVWQGVFRLQFQDPNNPSLYHTYSTFVGMDDNNTISGFGTDQPANSEVGVPNNSPTTYNLYQGTNFPTYGYLKSDPRTSRFGIGTARFTGANSDPTLGLTPTATSGGTMVTNWVDQDVPFVYDGGALDNNNEPFYRMDMYAINNPSVPFSGNVQQRAPSYITNADGAVRPGDATYSYNAANSYATPLVQGNYANRPVVLHRPFNSVGELGYVFRDDPWKTLDFFSPGSADAGLLDLFTLSEAPVLAGRVSPNTPYAPVAAALISGATQSSWTNSPNTNVTAANAQLLGAALTNASSASPFLSRADLEGRFMTNSAINNFSTIKTEREAVMRSLTESANTRTWNFLVDIIAQSGTYPPTATTLDNFAVTGERHYWLHVAIDRYTGQVVDQQLEAVDQ